MGTVGMLARCDFRHRWRSAVALTLLVGAIGAVVLATAAGARRSDSSFARFNVFSENAQAEISVGLPTAGQLDAFRRTPGVAAFALLRGYALNAAGNDELPIVAPLDSAMGRVIDRSRLIHGRRADPAAPDEITIGEGLSSQLHLGVGSHLDTVSYTPAQVKVGFSGGNPGAPAGPRVRLRIVGIERRPLDLADRAESGGIILLTPAFNTTYHDRVGFYTDVIRVRTGAGADGVAPVVAKARALWGHTQTFGVQALGIETEGARNAIDVLTLALWIFAGVTAIAGLVAIGIMLTRDITQVTFDQSTLYALGTTRGQRVAATGSRALIIAAGGALLAGVGAFCASPLFPLGLARRADPNVGLHADWVVLAIGVAIVACCVLAIAFTAAWRSSRPAPADRALAHRRPSPIVTAATQAGMPPTVTNGVRMALRGGAERSSVPVRSALAGAVFGVAGITAVLVFAGSLAHLVDTPRLSGWTWQLKTSVPTTPNVKCVDTNDHGLARARGVDAVAAVCIEDIQIDSRAVSAWGFQTLHGTIAPEVVAGRAPTGPDEIALGAVTLHAIHKHIGDTVDARGKGGAGNYTIVGRIVLPTIDEAQPLADGAAFTAAGLRPLITTGENETHFLLARFVPGADRTIVVRRLEADRHFTATGGPTTAVEVNRLEQINWFPRTLILLLAALALLAVGHALVTSVRRRRRELALLKTIGFSRRQVSATVAWQATTLAIVGLVVGIPVGLVAGRIVWQSVAGSLGVSTADTVPALALALTAAGALVLVNIIAFVPGRTAARTRPATALRSE